MKVQKKEKVIIKLSIKEAIIIRSEFGKLTGVSDGMKIVKLIESFDMAGV